MSSFLGFSWRSVTHENFPLHQVHGKYTIQDETEGDQSEEHGLSSASSEDTNEWTIQERTDLEDIEEGGLVLRATEMLQFTRTCVDSYLLTNSIT